MRSGDDPRRNLDGRPRREDPAEPVLDADLPFDLAAMRAAMHWEYEKLPKHPAVRAFVQARKKKPFEFTARWQALEEKLRELRSSSVQSAVTSNVESSDEPEEVDDPSGRRVVEEINVWLARCKQEAEERAKEYES